MGRPGSLHGLSNAQKTPRATPLHTSIERNKASDIRGDSLRRLCGPVPNMRPARTRSRIFAAALRCASALRCSRVTLHVEPLGPAAVRTWRWVRYGALLRFVASSVGHFFGATIPNRGVGITSAAGISYTEFAPSSRRLRKFLAQAGAAPPGLDQPNLELIDLDGRGLPGILSIENGVARYWSNTGGLRWSPPRSLPQFPAVFSTAEDRVQFADMDGNGAADVLVGSGDAERLLSQ